ncbi:DivIVA domain-containing protein [Mycetocola spongiae]|uniref:DivIVA domain-containing protein n=1 Tax=Mycetocola spongiae TaxID=2859226 RepID=UPI001CF5919A|nr:DivIVA domain-containing protein [Mycetocola spongiae]
MSATFPDNKRGTRGYQRRQVDAFLERARVAFEQSPDRPAPLTSEEIRHTSFKLVRHGYSTSHVDAALERLEDAFAHREREISLADGGESAWLARARESAQVILNRLARPEGERFNRVGRFTTGYDMDSVDAFADELRAYFQDGKPLAIDRVRTVVFPAQRRGYSEQQVDVVLDEVIEIMLAVR